MEWEERPLRAYAEVRLSRVASLNTACSGSETRPYVALENVESWRGQISDQTELETREPGSGSGVASVEPGDVLFGKLRPYLAKTWVADQPAYASTELLCMRPVPGVHSRWLGFVALSQPFVQWAVATSDGTKMPRTSWEKMGEYRLRLPDLAEQRLIADFLDAETARIDALIAKKSRLLDVLRERLSGFVEHQIRAVAEECGEIPLKFTVPQVTVGIVITPAKWYSDDGVPAIRGTNVLPGRIDLSDLVYLTTEGHALHQKSALREGDVVVVRTGQAGSAAVVPRELDGANCIDVLLIRRSTALLPRYLEYVINSDWTRKHIEAHSVGTIQSHFNVGSLRELRIPVPDLAVQQAVVPRLDNESDRVLRLTSALARQIDLLGEHRQALVTAAVTGELDIAESANEEAS